MKLNLLKLAAAASFCVAPLTVVAQTAPQPQPQPQPQPIDRSDGTPGKPITPPADRPVDRTPQPAQPGQPIDRADGTPGAQPAGARAAGDRADEAPLSAEDQKSMGEMFVSKAASGNKFEIEVSKLAQERATKENIRQFAGKLVAHHQQAQQNLMEAARKSNIPVSDQLEPAQQAKIDGLKKLNGRRFDMTYVNCQAGDHVTDMLHYRDAARLLQDENLKQYAQQTLPVLRQHLQEAMILAGMDQPMGDRDARPAGSVVPGGDRGDTDRPVGDRTNDRVDVPSRTDGTPDGVTDPGRRDPGNEQNRPTDGPGTVKPE